MTSSITQARTLSRVYNPPAPLPSPPVLMPSCSPTQIYALAWAHTQAQLQWQSATRAYWRAVALSN